MVKMAPPNKHGICIIHDRLENVFAPHNRTFFEESDRSAIEHTHTHPQIKKKSNQRNNNKFQKVLFFLFVSFINQKNKEKKKKMFVCAGRCLWD